MIFFVRQDMFLGVSDARSRSPSWAVGAGTAMFAHTHTCLSQYLQF